MNFLEIWSKALRFNIEQKPEELEGLMMFLYKMKHKKYALEIGSNFGGTAYSLCHIFEHVITLDIKYHENFDEIQSEFPNYNYLIGDSKSRDIIKLIENLDIKFDFIFIDGDHRYEFVKSDYENYKKFLSNEGVIGFHDIIESDLNKSLSNQVDILWKEFDSADKIEFISKEKSNQYNYESLFHILNSNTNYGDYGGIGILKKTPISIFVHNYLDNEWFDIVLSQFDKLKKSGLYLRADKIFYGVYSKSTTDLQLFLNLIQKLDTMSKIQIQVYEYNGFEFLTLINLYNYCRKNQNGFTLYFHTKGSSREYSREITSWRECLEYFNIEKWKNCVDKLQNETYDICGALYVDWFVFLDYKFEHYYSGNFWWANNKYISTLPNLSKFCGERVNAELWIGKNPHFWYNFYSEEVSNFYSHYFDPSVYKSD